MKILSLALSILLLPSMHSFASSTNGPPPTSKQCEICTPQSCGSDKDIYALCRRCDIIPEKFEACREAAVNAGFLAKTFATTMQAADAKSVTAKDAIPKLENLKQLIWIVQKRISLIKDQNKKQNFQQSALDILKFWQDYRNEVGLTEMNKDNSNIDPNTPIKNWSPERYATITSSIKTFDGLTCSDLQNQAKSMLSYKAGGITGKLWRNKSNTQTILNSLSIACQDVNVSAQQGVDKELENAKTINDLYQNFMLALDKK